MNLVPQIFDERRRRLRHKRALTRQMRPGAARWLPDAMAEDVIERLGFLRWEGDRMLVSGLGGDMVAKHLTIPNSHALIDFSRPIAGGPYDLIVSLGELDTINDLPGALILLRGALAPGGLLLAAFTGAGSLPKLRNAMLAADGEQPSARIHPQIDGRAASGLLQRAGFTRQVVDEHSLRVRFRDFDTVCSDLRDQGQSSILTNEGRTLDRTARIQAAHAFATKADDDGKISETIEIVTLTAWRD